MPHDFSLHSGERQTAASYSEIRADHRARYEWAHQRLPSGAGLLAPAGLDLFCGNGYGTSLLGQGRNVTGIDGSAEAIAFARQHYAGPSHDFVAMQWPFNLAERRLGFIVSLESIEHIADGAGFFAAMAAAIRPGGDFIYSTPNGDALPVAAFRPFHHRHYTLAETLALATGAGLEVVEWAGQNVYRPGITGVLADAAMGLQSATPGQFTIVHARRPALFA